MAGGKGRNDPGKAIAERIRALGPCSPGSYAELARDQGALSSLCSELREFADGAGDIATGDLMNGRIDLDDENAWMLRAHLE